MSKILTGKIIKTNMQKTVVVVIQSRRPHPIYKKLVKKTIKIKADAGDLELKVGDVVKMQEVRPISKGKHFKVIEVL